MLKYPSFADIERRRQTFALWNHFLNPDVLVKSGLFYLGGRDMVQCFHCGVLLHSWKLADNPDMEHLKHSPTCQFIKAKTRETMGFSTDLLFHVLENIQTIHKKIEKLERNLKENAHRENIDTVDYKWV